jgi:hypothetical protein
MPLLFSAVFSRALNYDTVFNNLSNPRVFTDFQLLACIGVLLLRRAAL